MLGGNAFGELGTGGASTASAFTPADVRGLKRGVRAIAAGGQTTCALMRAGGAKCWGENRVGQLGRPATPNGRTPVPVDVSRLGSGVRAIAAGGQHTCALMTGGAVKCWGTGYASGLMTPSNTPVDVAGLASGVRAIEAGNDQTCVLTSAGGVKCWGWNLDGQLGNGTRTYSYTPVDVAGLASGVSAISAGAHFACALTSGGGAKCWGNNFFGQLGNGLRTAHPTTTPVDVAGLASGVTAISTGRHFTCALTTGGGVKCWGDNTYGQLGNGSRTASNTPVDVSGLTRGVSAITAGSQHICALMRGGGVKCWGLNHGRLGNGSRTEFSTKPVDVRLR